MMQTLKQLIGMDRLHSTWLQGMVMEMWWQFCWLLGPRQIMLTVTVGLHSEQQHGEDIYRSESSQMPGGGESTFDKIYGQSKTFCRKILLHIIVRIVKPRK
jgi:hypothetical protein